MFNPKFALPVLAMVLVLASIMSSDNSIQADSVSTTVAAGTFPGAMVVNPVTNKLYVANSTGDNVTVIDGSDNLTSLTSANRQPVGAAESGSQFGTAGTGDGFDDDSDGNKDDGFPFTIYIDTFSFDHGNLMTQAATGSETSTFTFDGDGLKISQTNDGSTTDLTDGSGNPTAGYGYDVLKATRSATGSDPSAFLLFSMVDPNADNPNETVGNRKFEWGFCTGNGFFGGNFCGGGGGGPIRPPPVKLPTAKGAAPVSITITSKQMRHVREEHGFDSLVPKKGKFFEDVNIRSLIRKGEGANPTRQPKGNYQRIINADRTIGIDRATGLPTSTYPIITTPSNSMVTAFPGVP